MPKVKYVRKWAIPSNTNPNKRYVVALTEDGTYKCSCPHWIYRRKICFHIRQAIDCPDENIIDVNFTGKTVDVIDKL